MSVLAKKEKILEIVKQKPNLQCLPFVAIKAIELVNNPRSTTRDLCKLIRTDASLTARVLREINSVEFALSRKIADLEQAVLYLGFDRIKKITLIASTKKLQENKMVINLFKRNLLLANIARYLCKNFENFNTSEESFIAGLLQGTGQILLLEKFPGDYFPLLKYRGEDLVNQEIQTFGIPSVFVSAELILAWDLPEQISKAVRNSITEPSKHSEDIEVAMFLANKLAEFSIKTGIPNEFFQAFNRDALAKLKLSPIQIKQVFNDAYNKYLEVLDTMFGDITANA